MNEDYHNFLEALVAHDARFLIVGAHALAVHGYPRATVDIDICVDRSPENARRVWRALADFGAPLADLDVSEHDFTRRDVVAQFGIEPGRIDILTGVSGMAFDAAWANHIKEAGEGVRDRFSGWTSCARTSVHPPETRTAPISTCSTGRTSGRCRGSSSFARSNVPAGVDDQA